MLNVVKLKLNCIGQRYPNDVCAYKSQNMVAIVGWIKSKTQNPIHCWLDQVLNLFTFYQCLANFLSFTLFCWRSSQKHWLCIFGIEARYLYVVSPNPKSWWDLLGWFGLVYCFTVNFQFNVLFIWLIHQVLRFKLMSNDTNVNATYEQRYRHSTIGCLVCCSSKGFIKGKTVYVTCTHSSLQRENFSLFSRSACES